MMVQRDRELIMQLEMQERGLVPAQSEMALYNEQKRNSALMIEHQGSRGDKSLESND